MPLNMCEHCGAIWLGSCWCSAAIWLILLAGCAKLLINIDRFSRLGLLSFCILSKNFHPSYGITINLIKTMVSHKLYMRTYTTLLYTIRLPIRSSSSCHA